MPIPCTASHRKSGRNRLLQLVALVIGCLVAASSARGEPPQTGPETEKRFPPLVVPTEFKATLFACDPLIEYPSAIALGPKPRSIFVAIDYMTGLGTDIVRHDEIRLVEDTDGDGYADKATVYADGFNSVMGLEFHGGAVYVMHSPFLTALRDTDGDGKADERRDLLKGLGLPPEENDVRLHCANGVVMGHDGWLYLALGDHGCDVTRPEGDRLVHHGGGILRCRPDGRDLHVFARGLRNIYDVALDDELNVFVRDNENDGGDYKIRVCYSFCGADHGYPYLYYERPDEALPPLADLGLGSSAGGVCYLERQFAAEYRGNLFFCEWGRAVVRYHPLRSGTGFAPLTETQFAAGAETDPYGFKPTDLVVDRDGSLIVADWCDGQRPKRGRGRIYRITHGGAGVTPDNIGSLAGGTPAPRLLDMLIDQLNSDSYYERVLAQEVISARGHEGLDLVQKALSQKDHLGARARMHAVWILAREGSDASREKLFDLARNDPDAHVQVQAVRALADLCDPVFVDHRLDAGPADAAIAARLAELTKDKDPRVLLEVIVAVGRVRWAGAPEWLRKMTADKAKLDPVLSHAAMQTLRRSGNWPAVVELLDLPDSEPIRPIALRAVADQFAPEVIDGLIERIGDGDASRRREYADALTRVCKQPGPWEYWGYRPPPRPANTATWEKTAAIEQALDRVLADSGNDVRLAVLRRVQREKIPTRLETLAAWLAAERGAKAVAAILDSLKSEPADRRRDALVRIVATREHAEANRLAALKLLTGDASKPHFEGLLALGGALEDGPVLAELLGQLGAARRKEAMPLMSQKLNSHEALVRAAAVQALADIGAVESGATLIAYLGDQEAPVRRAAADAMGRLKVGAAVEPLLRLAADADPQVRRACLDSLRQLGERRAVPLAVTALADRTTQPAALACLAELGGPEQAQALIDLAKSDPTDAVVTTTATALTKWTHRSVRLDLSRTVLELQGRSGLLVRWQTAGPLAGDALQSARQRALKTAPTDGSGQSPTSEWQTTLAQGLSSEVKLRIKTASENGSWLAYADLLVPDSTSAQFLASANGKFAVWLNGRQIYERTESRAFQPDSDRFDAALVAGPNRLVVQVTPQGDSAEFHVRFRRKSSTAELEKFVQAALTRTGDAERGRKVFFDADKAQCIKCHRLGDQGERIGPELTGLGARFSRIHIVESILEPSRTVTPGFQTLNVRLADGQVITGIRIAETDSMLTLADQKGEKHAVAKAEIEAQQLQSRSIMPDGLAQQFTVEQFVDLVAFLTSQKETRTP